MTARNRIHVQLYADMTILARGLKGTNNDYTYYLNPLEFCFYSMYFESEPEFWLLAKDVGYTFLPPLTAPE